MSMDVLKDRDPREMGKRLQEARVACGKTQQETADFLRDGIYELRAKRGRVNYRLLYFFHGRNVAIVAHALTKEAEVPRADIDRALARRRAFVADPEGHTYRE